MDRPPPDLKQLIADRVAAAAADVWTPGDFLDLGSRDAVDKALQRLVAREVLRRIDRGLYDSPRFNPLTGSTSVPDYRRVMDAIVRRDQIRMLVDGMTAANDLGLSDAVPGRIVMHVDARLWSHSHWQANHHLPPYSAEQAVLGEQTRHAGRPGIALATPRAQQPYGEATPHEDSFDHPRPRRPRGGYCRGPVRRDARAAGLDAGSCARIAPRRQRQACYTPASNSR